MAGAEDQQFEFGFDDLDYKSNWTSLLVKNINEIGDAAPFRKTRHGGQYLLGQAFVCQWGEQYSVTNNDRCVPGQSNAQGSNDRHVFPARCAVLNYFQKIPGLWHGQ